MVKKQINQNPNLYSRSIIRNKVMKNSRFDHVSNLIKTPVRITILRKSKNQKEITNLKIILKK